MPNKNSRWTIERIVDGDKEVYTFLKSIRLKFNLEEWLNLDFITML